MSHIQIINDSYPLPLTVEQTVSSIGVFDGVHRGHQRLLDLVKDEARSHSIPSVVVTFDKHPTQITSPQNAPRILTPLNRKIQLLEELEIDYVYVLAFNEHRASTPAVQFIREIFSEAIRASSIYVGEDFQFGHKRLGNVNLLKSEGKSLGITVNGVGLYTSDYSNEEVISSTVIRKHLQDGELALANKKLGRPHQISGKVISGDKRGRTIGFPTANISVDAEIAVPADGVYAAWYLLQDGNRKLAAVNIGKRPTFSDSEVSVVEAHILDFDGDLYGNNAVLVFEKRIRSEKKFAGLKEFQQQLEIDLTEIRATLT